MEIVLRCAVPDRPGALARLAGTIGECGGDIEAVEVLDHDGEGVLDDFTVVIDAADMRTLVDRLDAMDDVDLVHAGPSRGGPGDAVSRVAIGMEALLTGAMPAGRAIVTLVGGVLRASDAELCLPEEAPRADRRTLVLPVDHDVLVVRRDYPFTPTEQQRATTLVRACLAAGPRAQPSPTSRSG